MRNILHGMAWTFIVAAAVYDGLFAWEHRQEFSSWERNPLAAGMVGAVGLPAVLGFKATGLAFAFLVAVACHRRHQRLANVLTGSIGTAYLALVLVYSAGSVRPEGCYGIPPNRLIGMPAHAPAAQPLAAAIGFAALAAQDRL
jgi:hypothetical protein